MNLNKNHAVCGCNNDTQGRLVEIMCPIKGLEADNAKLRSTLEKIVELNEHPRSCLSMSENIPPLSCDCGIMLAKEALKT